MRYLIVLSLLRRCAVSLIYGGAFLDVMLDSKKRHCCDIMLLSFLDTWILASCLVDGKVEKVLCVLNRFRQN